MTETTMREVAISTTRKPLIKSMGRELRKAVLYAIGAVVFATFPMSKCRADGITLTLGIGSIVFPNASPLSVPSIAATQNPVSVVVVYVGFGSWNLTVMANGDLQSGTDTIPVSNVSWTASGTGFQSGTLSKTIPKTVMNGTSLITLATGSLRFFLQNSWNYPTGAYSQTITFTATSF